MKVIDLTTRLRVDVGASQLIIDGKIKLKNGGVKSFTKDSLVFEDGSLLKADVVVLATGLVFHVSQMIKDTCCLHLIRFIDTRSALDKLMGEAVTSKISPIWGLTDEGELRGVWKDCGVPNFYYMLGIFSFFRHLYAASCSPIST